MSYHQVENEPQEVPMGEKDLDISSGNSKLVYVVKMTGLVTLGSIGLRIQIEEKSYIQNAVFDKHKQATIEFDIYRINKGILSVPATAIFQLAQFQQLLPKNIQTLEIIEYYPIH